MKTSLRPPIEEIEMAHNTQPMCPPIEELDDQSPCQSTISPSLEQKTANVINNIQEECAEFTSLIDTKDSNSDTNGFNNIPGQQTRKL